VKLHVCLLFACLALLPQIGAAADDAKTGYLIDVPVPLDAASADAVLERLDTLTESAPADSRLVVVMRYGPESEGGQATAFEDALKLARAISGVRLRSLRIVSLVQGELRGHSVLPVLASDALLLAAALAG